MTAGTARGAALRGLLGRGWRNVRAAGPRRLAATLALLAIALIVARLSWQLPVVGDAERALYDLRAFVSAPRVEQDQRIQIVIYDDQTLIAARKRSPLDRGLLAQALANIDAMGAKAIGVETPRGTLRGKGTVTAGKSPMRRRYLYGSPPWNRMSRSSTV